MLRRAHPAEYRPGEAHGYNASLGLLRAPQGALMDAH